MSQNDTIKSEKNDKAMPSSASSDAVLSRNNEEIANSAYLNNPPPIYPEISRRYEEQGLVLLNVSLSENGEVLRVILYKTSGFENLDNAALNAVKNWKFIAAKNGGRNVSSIVEISIRFTLK